MYLIFEDEFAKLYLRQKKGLYKISVQRKNPIFWKINSNKRKKKLIKEQIHQA